MTSNKYCCSEKAENPELKSRNNFDKVKLKGWKYDCWTHLSNFLPGEVVKLPCGFVLTFYRLCWPSCWKRGNSFSSESKLLGWVQQSTLSCLASNLDFSCINTTKVKKYLGLWPLPLEKKTNLRSKSFLFRRKYIYKSDFIRSSMFLQSEVLYLELLGLF